MWHDTYLSTVLRPDDAYARAHLLPHLFDALTAHALMLDTQGLPHAGQAASLLRALRRAPFPPYDPQVEDVFFSLDRRLADEDPEAAGALRTALSRNDLDMTLYRLNARERLMRASQRLLHLRRTLLDLAGREVDTVIVAYTHHQPAQPTTLAHYLAGLENVLARDTGRMFAALGRVNLSPMGAVALAGTSFPIDRQLTSRLLAFDRPIENTYDAVSASDWQVELAGTVTAAATTLSRGVYDLLLWASRGLLTLEDGLVQGSSVMPQKRNPVALEHARTKFSKAIGATQSVMLCAHNVPFGDINDPGPDMQPPLHSMWQELCEGVELLTAALTAPVINRTAWREEAEGSGSAVTELADVIARQQGGGFRQAHGAVKTLLAQLQASGRPLASVTAGDLAPLGVQLPERELAAALDPAAFIARRTTFGGPAPAVMRGALHTARERLEQDILIHQHTQQRFADARTRLEGGTEG
ncbi:argininosuccinate lyase [Deinococcus metallilatus]|uniref:argininosuccinate lyase n=1 Tax=Deinococcus metallilatus TaxID=1211322 RepID=A0AAJ5F3W2_9DEIO|nr:lyase family protein [Deinococcus metallilatus]MBB5294992.1 argininosuccinate lyase [Deinococcus metallilatus]QBY09315.1 argininosuccinate lyase [Deinococcus metallilatus]RXJ09320.1 argininosuccinate lyase [Deinococcus metallilatus]TLK28842.1 argininosuccinate lyase [Deinococcus metallilatus]GMA16924.1 argininosuccinate lyase [Deinococcus metallilatus]